MHARSILSLSWFSVALAFSARAAERDVREVFPVQPGCTLKIDSYRGTVHVTESDESVVRVSIHLEIGADNEADAERMREAMQLEVKAANNTVSIVARNPRETRARWVWHEDEQIDLVYRISVPRQCNVDLHVRNGSITVGNLAGRMTARMENGTVFFKRIEGSIDASTDYGDVVVSRCSGAVRARVLRGAIRTGTIGGAADLENSSGDIEILSAGGSVLATAEAGDVVVGFPRAIGDAARLTSRGGNVRVRIDPAANCRIEASSLWGRVQCTLPATVEAGAAGSAKLTARLNHGGPVLALRASGGFVRIEPGETLFE